MATYVLIHGAAGDSWDWHLVAPQLHARGHEVIAPDLPCEDDSAGLEEYADTVVNAIGDRSDLIVVAHSLGGFTGPIVCERLKADLLVMVTAMVPKPGEVPGQWWANTGHAEAKRQLDEHEGRDPDAAWDMATIFMQDVPPELVAEALARGERDQSGTPFAKPWPLKAWPNVPTRFLLCRDDRLFPADFMRRIVRERLGIIADEIDSGHMPSFSRPKELVERLETYRTELTKDRRSRAAR